MTKVVRTIHLFDNKMTEEEEMEKQVNGTFDECAYVNVKDDDDLCALASMILNVRSIYDAI